MNEFEVKNSGLAKFHPNLLQAFSDLGVEVSHGKVRSDDDTPARMALAVAQGGAKRFLHIVDCLSCMRLLPTGTTKYTFYTTIFTGSKYPKNVYLQFENKICISSAAVMLLLN